MNEARESAADGTEFKVKSFSLPTSLAAYVEAKGKGNASAFVASLIEQDQQREHARQWLREFGFVGDMEITDEGRARARARLNTHAASRTRRGHGPQQQAAA
jgi:hypothetical protein